MKLRTLIGALILGSTVAFIAGLAPQSAGGLRGGSASAGAESFGVDTVHSSVVFKIQHMGVSNFYGRFNDISGSYNLDQATPANSAFDFQVKTESVDTKNSKRDGHLKSPDFFNAGEFPIISFKSTKVAKAGDNQLRVNGDLTLHGVTKPINTTLTLFPAKQTPQGYKGGFETTFKIKRTDFDMDTFVAEGGLGDDVEITVAVEGQKP
jgi:polyisoprenoid-binding protein YceI